MILTTHIITGAILASKIVNPYYAAFVAIFSHYFLDNFNHWDYSIKSILNKEDRNYKNYFISLLKIAADFATGFLLIFLFAKNSSLNMALFGGFFGALPDGFLFLSTFSPLNKFLKPHTDFHKIIHSDKKLPLKKGAAIQTIIILISLLLI